MTQKAFTIINNLGLHARAAAKFVNAASAFNADILVRKNGREVNGKSIMGVMMLAAAKGTEIIVEADGEDADAALVAIGNLIADYFGEGQ